MLSLYSSRFEARRQCRQEPQSLAFDRFHLHPLDLPLRLQAHSSFWARRSRRRSLYTPLRIRSSIER